MSVDSADEGGQDFGVQPEALRAYAATVRVQGGDLRDVGGVIGAIGVDRGWFGKLPQSGHLADDYETHHQVDVAAIADLVTVLLDVATALTATAARYSAVEHAAAGALRAVRSGGTGPARTRAPLAEAIR